MLSYAVSVILGFLIIRKIASDFERFNLFFILRSDDRAFLDVVECMKDLEAFKDGKVVGKGDWIARKK